MSCTAKEEEKNFRSSFYLYIVEVCVHVMKLIRKKKLFKSDLNKVAKAE